MQWNQLEQVARKVLDRTLATFPPEIRVHVDRIPLSLRETPSPEMEEEGIAADTLGLFVGESLQEAGLTDLPMPGQILLFLRNIWEFAEGDPDLYREEVRITWLHELGHYFGWDEADLFDRDLD